MWNLGDPCHGSAVSQGYETNRSIEETLEIGWKLLREMPKSELKRIRDAYLEKYYDQKEG